MHWLEVAVTVLLTLLGAVASNAYFYGRLTQRVSNQGETDKRHEEWLKRHDERLSDHGERIAGLES